MGDEGKRISLMKVDIEAMEFNAILDWVDSGMLSIIDQIHIELHTSHRLVGRDKNIMVALSTGLIQHLDLFDRMFGLKLIHYNPNLFIGKKWDLEQTYYSMFDITLYKYK